MSFGAPSKATQFVEMVRALPKGKLVLFEAKSHGGNLVMFDERMSETLYQFDDLSLVLIQNENLGGRELPGDHEDATNNESPYDPYGVQVVGFSDEGTPLPMTYHNLCLVRPWIRPEG